MLEQTLGEGKTQGQNKIQTIGPHLLEGNCHGKLARVSTFQPSTWIWGRTPAEVRDIGLRVKHECCWGSRELS